jgi:hypothetical protein
MSYKMPVMINNKRFNHVSYSDEAIKELLKSHTPEPKIVVKTVCVNDMTPQNAIGVLEGEIVFVDTSIKQDIQFIFTKKMLDCISILMTSGTQHALIHVTALIPKLDLASVINKFKDKENISVTLLGGLQNNPRSNNNLTNVIEALLQAAEDLDIPIKIKSQKIMQRNAFSGTNKFVFIYDRIIEGANFLSQHYFKKPLDKNIIKDFSTENFKKSSGGIVDRNSINIFVAAISNANLLFFTEKPENLKETDDFLKQCKEDAFIIFLKSLFSPAGYTAMTRHFNMDALSTVSSELYNFAIDIKNDSISEVSEFIEMPNEISRNARFLDPDQKREYHFCYDTDHEEPVCMRSDFIMKCMPLVEKTQAHTINDKDIYDFYATLYPERPFATDTAAQRYKNVKSLTKIHKFMSYLKDDLAPYLKLMQQVRNHSNNDPYAFCMLISALYIQASISLQDLNQSIKSQTTTFEPAFVAYKRLNTNATEHHALMSCDSWATANNIAEELTRLDKKADVLITRDQGFCVRIKKIT